MRIQIACRYSSL